MRVDYDLRVEELSLMRTQAMISLSCTLIIQNLSIFLVAMGALIFVIKNHPRTTTAGYHLQVRVRTAPILHCTVMMLSLLRGLRYSALAVLWTWCQGVWHRGCGRKHFQHAVVSFFSFLLFPSLVRNGKASEQNTTPTPPLRPGPTKTHFCQ